MIIGIGIDLIEIDRIKNAIEKNDKFLNKIYTAQEIELFNQRHMNYNTIAANFAAKEAVSKALGTGIKFNWKDIEVLRTQEGKPYVNLYNEAQKILQKLNGKRVFISIAHNKSDCIANCIITSGGEIDEGRL